MDDIKKIIISSSDERSKKKSKSKSKKDNEVYEKLANEPDIIKNYVKSLGRKEVETWINPNVSKPATEITNAIEEIKRCIKKTKKQSFTTHSSKKEEHIIPKQNVEIIPKQNVEIIPKQHGGKSKKEIKKKINTKRTRRNYKSKEINQIVSSCKELYCKKKYTEFHKALKKMNANQCYQILSQQLKINSLKKNIPLPILKYILYIHLSCPYIEFIPSFMH